MKKNTILIVIGLGIIAVIIALIYADKITFDKMQKNSNIESLEHSGAGDIE